MGHDPRHHRKRRQPELSRGGSRLGVEMDAEHADALTWKQLSKFIDALLNAYPRRAEFEMMLTYQLERPDALPDDGSLKQCAYELIRNAKGEGWLQDIINAALEDRPRNPQLKKWAIDIDQIAAARPGTSPQEQLLDTAYFDLDEVRRAVARAKNAAQDRVLGFGITNSEIIFIRKFSDWLGSYLGETQVKEPLNLRPEYAPVSRRLRHIARYRYELDSANVLCIVYTDGTPAETVEEFWRGVCREFAGIAYYLVLVFAGDAGALFPQGINVLPSPQFEVSDVDLWTHEMIRRRGWPTELADAWTDRLRHESMDGDGLDVRLLYEAMDASIEDARFRPEIFRRQLEERTGHAYTTSA